MAVYTSTLMMHIAVEIMIILYVAAIQYTMVNSVLFPQRASSESTSNG